MPSHIRTENDSDENTAITHVSSANSVSKKYKLQVLNLKLLVNLFKKIDNLQNTVQSLTSRNRYYKTKICRFWREGYCYHGDNCRFAHGEQELRPLH